MNAPLELTADQARPHVDVNLIPPKDGHMGEMYADLATAQGEFESIEKNQTAHIKAKDASKASYSFMYADMGEIGKKTTPALSKNGIAVISIPTVRNKTTGGHVLRTMLAHKSGARIESILEIPDQGEVKNFGGYITYLRRYQVSAMLNIAADSDLDSSHDDDDDHGPRIGGGGSRSPSPTSHAELPSLAKAGSIAELNKAWQAVSLENRPKFQAQYDACMDKLDPPPPVDGKGRTTDGSAF